MDNIIFSYTAGLFDGEGSIVIGVSKPNKNNTIVSPNHWLQVGITNTDRRIIDWLSKMYGGHISDNSHAPSRKSQRPCWQWRILSNQAIPFLKNILPYLICKKEQAIIAIEFQEKRQGHSRSGCKRLPDEVIAEREICRTNLRALTLGKHSLL